MKRTALLLLTIALFISGCSVGVSDNETSTEGKASVPAEGGVLNIASYSPDTLNPLATRYSCVRDFLYLIYEGLFTVNEDLSVRGVLAEDYTVTEGNRVYTVNLRQGVKFHDGSAFTAADVIATFEYIQRNQTVYSENLSDVASYSSKGDYCVVINLKEPRAAFVNNLDFPILPSGLTQRDFAPENSAFAPNGTGRYAYAKTNPYVSITLTKNTEWRDAAKVYIPEVCVRFVKDNESMLYAFDSGETDLITTERGRWGEFSYSGDFRTFEVTTLKYTFLALNTRSSVFSDANLRQSVANAIDKDILTDNLLFSHACAADTPISSKAYFAGSGEKQPSGEAGTGSSGLREKGLSFYLLYNEESSRKQETADFIKSSLEEEGVEVVLSKVDFETYTRRIAEGNYQAYIGEVDIQSDCNLEFMFDTAPVQPSQEAYEEGEAQAEKPSEQKIESEAITDFSSAELDSLISTFNAAVTQNDMTVAYSNLKSYFYANTPHIPLFHLNEAMLVNRRIKGSIRRNLTNLYADLGDIYIEESK